MSPLRRFLEYVRPYTSYLVLAACGGFIKFLLPMIFPQVMRYFVDNLLVNANQMTPAMRSAAIRQIYLYSLILIGLYFFIWIPGVYIRHYYAGKLAQKVTFDLRFKLFQHIQRQSASYFDHNKSGGIVSRLINDIGQAKNMLGSAMTNIWIDGSILITLLIIMVQMDLVLTLISISILPFYVVTIRTIGIRVKDSSRKVQSEMETIQGDVQEKIAAAAVIQAFTMENREQKNFYQKAKRLFDFHMQREKLNALNQAINGFLTKVGPVLIIWYSALSILQGRLTIGEMTAFYAYLGMFYMPLNRFAQINTVYSNSMAAIERVFEVFDEEPDVREEADAINVQELRGEVEFCAASFSYEEKSDPVLKNINLKVRPGEKIALVGSSGSGKSTLVNLIPRFYDLTSGQLLLDGRDIRQYKLKSLRRHIGIVLQEPILFSGTLQENLRYGNPRANDWQIFEALQAANAYEFVKELPHGLETEIGEKGATLSGGQKQRITITRAFLKDPKILILDEATSALDSESENLIQASLEDLMVGRTTFIIAHRLSTIINVDRIVVLDHGEIQEIGSHQELMQEGGLYKKFFEEQFKDALKFTEQHGGASSANDSQHVES